LGRFEPKIGKPNELTLEMNPFDTRINTHQEAFLSYPQEGCVIPDP